VRRPSQNARQRQYAREQRALLALRRAAAIYTAMVDLQVICDELNDAGERLEAAAMRYANTLTPRDRKRLIARRV